MKKLKLVISFLILLSAGLSAQVKDFELGAGLDRSNRLGGFYDYSDPTSINISVSVWGFVRYPGKYMVPINTSMIDLLSFAGGPTNDANMDDLRLYRVKENGEDEMTRFSYNDLIWEDDLQEGKRYTPQLQASDVFVVPGAPRLFFRDWFSIGLSVFSALISLSILILNITRN